MKRVFLIVLDSFGIGAMEDAGEYGDFGVNTIRSVSTSSYFHVPNMKKLGLFNIDGVELGEKEEEPTAVFARMTEASKGKDTTIGHWEIAGIYSGTPLPTYPQGFPDEVICEFSKRTGRDVICNQPYSGTDVIRDFGKEHMETGALIVYTSADSVFQIAAHEDIVSVEELYRYCEIARNLLQGKHGVGRVIARPFITENDVFVRTSKRHDFSLIPPKVTMLDQLKEHNYEVISVGKINDIFAGKGITKSIPTSGNEDGIDKIITCLDEAKDGLVFINLVDFDMLYGHRNNIDGYAKALAYFDEKLPEIMCKLKSDDILMITADHGCDPGYITSTDHSREYTPFLLYGENVTPCNLGTRETFADIGATVLQYFGINPQFKGKGLFFTKETV